MFLDGVYSVIITLHIYIYIYKYIYIYIYIVFRITRLKDEVNFFVI